MIIMSVINDINKLNIKKMEIIQLKQKIEELNELKLLKKLETEKSSYEDLVNVSTDSEVESANQNYNYMIDFLLILI
mgnify:CR=1 FL=1